MATTSKEINLDQLTQELGGIGLIADFNDPNNKIILPADGQTLPEAKLLAAIEAHIALPVVDKRKEILEKLGLTENEISILLS
jgi:hypothetical protein